VFAHQFIAQISENGLHEAVLGNCGTIVSFRIGAEDARVIARAISAPEKELMTISRGRAYVRTLRDCQPTLTRPMRTERAELAAGRMAAQVRNTRANFARPRRLAEQRDAPKRREWN
jgi:hypothetical protein